MFYGKNINKTTDEVVDLTGINNNKKKDSRIRL